MSVPLLDLARQYAYLKPEMDEAVLKVLDHGWFILGPEVTDLEEEIAKLCQVKYANGVASGTDALLLALDACGVGVGDEVITTAFSFFATAGVIVRLGAKPVFVDIEDDTYNIDPSKIEAAITDKTKVILPVHLFGQVADMDPIMEIAKRHNLKVVEDAAQAIGAEYKGKPAGSFGDFGCFSFYPTKNLGAGGDGGIVVCNNEEDYKLVKIFRNHGAEPKYYHKIVGYNSRLASIQAAILNIKLPYLRGWSEKRIKHAKFYDESFKDVAQIKTPNVRDYTTFHIYNQYTIEVPDREALIEKFKANKIGFEIYYPVPFHTQECFADLGYSAEDFPLSEKASKNVIALPIFPELTQEELEETVKVVKEAVL